MKILISNDDGVTASGIFASKKAVEDLGNTLVIAPELQQSGIGHALTLYEPLRVKERILKDGSIAYGVTGTPTDAVTIGLFELLDEKPDLMISGINTGFNLGKAELTTSGTVGAALEAASFGIPTIAMIRMYGTASSRIRGACVFPITISDRISLGYTRHTIRYGMSATNPASSLNINACCIPPRSFAPKNCVRNIPPVMVIVLIKTINTKST